MTQPTSTTLNPAAAERRARICGIFVELFELDPSAIVPTARLKDDLKLDSLDHVDLILELEKIVGRRLPADELRGILTVDDVERLVERMMPAA